MIETLFAAVGGSIPVAVLAVFALGAAFLYALWIAFTFLRGYREASSLRSEGLAVGLVLVTSIPIGLRFLAATMLPIGGDIIALFTTAIELLGLLVVLATLYFPGGEQS
ncbi:hypothetical protein [Halodesulfurarchaeum formicicum]|uniref:Uncharacterized protein n=1 Tax=Halodesulfurarchaeum formicicum TaxID=1873524 RepID=A0A1J1A9C7_9EURY|nr:hypothetical protein [Halodesulfurarchaeum formicicum]APE94716.1 hypothetical protein HSR6_0248 [Halodesulfurarchaeum formicicum]